MSQNINVFITANGIPQIGLSPLPTIKIYDAVTNTLLITDVTEEIGGGFYKYVIATLNPDVNYLAVVDAGASFADSDRYYYGEVEQLNDLDAQTIWNHSVTNTFAFDSFAALLAVMNSSVTLTVNAVTILLKYQNNRTKIDPVTSTLIIYDNDEITPLKVFNLYNNNGVLDVNTVFERVPQ